MFRFASCLLLVALAPITAGALDFHYHGGRIEAYGIIEVEDPERFRQVLERHANTSTVVLSSIGGDVQSAIQIGRTIRRVGLTTIADHVCDSACGYIFMGGVERHAGDDVIGIHDFHMDNDTPEARAAVTAMILTYLDEMGVDRRYHEMAAAVPNESVVKLSAADLDDLNVSGSGGETTLAISDRPSVDVRPVSAARTVHSMPSLTEEAEKQLPERIDGRWFITHFEGMGLAAMVGADFGAVGLYCGDRQRPRMGMYVFGQHVDITGVAGIMSWDTGYFIDMPATATVYETISYLDLPLTDHQVNRLRDGIHVEFFVSRSGGHHRHIGTITLTGSNAAITEALSECI